MFGYCTGYLESLCLGIIQMLRVIVFEIIQMLGVIVFGYYPDA